MEQKPSGNNGKKESGCNVDVVQAQIPGLDNVVVALQQLIPALNNLTAAFQANVQATQALNAGFSIGFTDLTVTYQANVAATQALANSFIQLGQTFSTSLAAVTTAIQNIPASGTPS